MEQKELNSMVKKIVSNIMLNNPTTGANGVFTSMNEAVEEAYKAQQNYKNYALEQRRQIVEGIRSGLRPYIEECAKRGVDESKMGRYEDKINKNTLVLDKTPGVEDLSTSAFTGDNGLTLVELSPFGVIGSITPVTNPTETIICNSLGMLAGGNAVVFSPHPSAIETSVWLVKLINRLASEAGAPPNLVTTVDKATLESVDEMMSHPKINMLCITGGTPIVKKGLSSGKKTIGAGAGNPPVIVDETADIEQAAKDIFNGASFDNNMPCIAEKVVLVVEAVADYLLFCLEKENIFKVTDPEDLKKLEKTILNEKGAAHKDFVGKNALHILQQAGVSCGYDPRLIIVETSKEHLFAVEELMMPVLPIVRCKDFDEALENAVVLENNLRHSAMMHSKNVDRLTEAARRIQTTIFVKNAPSYSGIGFGGEGYTTFTIAGPTGEGLTSARSFVRTRRCVLKNGFYIR